MNKLLSTMFALAVASATAHAQQITGDARAGERKIAMCIGCHGIPGYQASFPEIHRVPMISGQNAPYIVAALNAYKGGERRHPTMRGIAESMSEQDMADVAAFYTAHGRNDGDAPVPEQPARQPGERVAALLQKGACVACHGANFAKPLDPSYPTIAGQHADYLYVSLRAYKTENNALVGRSNGVMAGVVKQFSNAELKAMSQYIASLPGPLKTVPERRFR